MSSVQIGQKNYEMPPREGISVAHFLTVADVERSARYYEKVFGARILSLGDGNAPGYLDLANIWMIGPVTFQASLDSLRRCGTFCWYGPVLGGPGALDIMSLPRSIKTGYASFVDHVHTPTLLRAHSAQLFDWIARGVLKVRIGGTYPLAEASRAHADMESRSTTGKLLLIP